MNNTNLNVTVVVNPLPPPPATASNNGPLCNGNTLNLSCSSVASSTYSWIGPLAFFPNNQNPSIASFSPLKAGTYTVRSIRNGCVSATGRSTTVASPTCRVAIKDGFEEVYELGISPNPAQSQFTITLPFQEGASTIEITSLEGKPMGKYKTDGEEYLINSSDWEAGMYMLNITHNGVTE